MLLNLLKAKIHRATVTEANLAYEGSITIDKNILEASGIFAHEQVHVVDINNGNRFVTYVIEGKPGSGVMCVNGAAARLVSPGDKIIVIAYCHVTHQEAGHHYQTQAYRTGRQPDPGIAACEPMGKGWAHQRFP